MQSIRNLALCAAAAVLLGSGWFVWDQRFVPHDDRGRPFRLHRVAHAGGGLDKATYTNSYQALEHSIALGFKYFELDFVFSSDGHLVCLHDWESNFRNTFGFATAEPLTLAEFEALADGNPKWTNCTLAGLGVWMGVHPEATIVSDVKDDNLRALELITHVLPDAGSRVIPQIYRPDDFDSVVSMGFEQIIWTLYRYRGDHRDVLRAVRDFSGPVAVTMPEALAATRLPQALALRGIPTYVHTINSRSMARRYLEELGISEIYTDVLPP